MRSPIREDDREAADSRSEAADFLRQEEAARLAEDEVAPVVSIFVTLVGQYAALVALALQIDVIRRRIGVQEGTERLVAFSTAVALLNVADFAGLLLQSYLFAALSPQQRVGLGQMLTALSNALAALLWYAGPRPLSTSIAGVIAVFMLCGAGMGIARPNVLAVVSLFGRRANRWYGFGTAVGGYVTTVGMYGLTWAAGDDAREWVPLSRFMYIGAFVVCSAGSVLFLRLTPPKGSGSLNSGGAMLLRHLPKWREWVPPARLYCATFAIAAFSLAFVDALIQLAYHPRPQEVIPGVLTVPPAGVMTLYCIVGFAGSWFGSMTIGLPRPLLISVAVSCTCVALVLTKVPLLALLAGVAPFASGICFITVVAHLREAISPSQLTAAMTLFILVGDASRFLALSAAGAWVNIVSVAGSAS